MHPISPIDGRYAPKVDGLSDYFSEKALMHYRCKVELLYLLALNKTGLFPPISEAEKRNVEAALNDFTEEDYQRIKEIERVTNHDVKACEMFLREKTGIQNVHLIHFGMTSEDANNLAYTLMLKGYRDTYQLPQIKSVLELLGTLAEKWKHIPFPSRTHGQKASPSTAGKEMAVFVNRILRVYNLIKGFDFTGKINGAVGNYSASLAAFPDFDWMTFAHDFLADIGLSPNMATTQIEDHDTWALYFNYTRMFNNILIDLDVDCWLYISKNLFSEKSNANEVGSSTMPHKVNPINFENSEGNLLLSNANLGFLSDKLCRSRMQRDLSDSTVERNMGVALSYGYLGVFECIRGLKKLQINEGLCRKELQDSPELLAEPIQTMLKIEGIDDPYSLLKKASRGKTPTRETLMDLVDGLAISEAMKSRIHQLTPETYIGDAVRVCDAVLERLKGI